MKNFLPVVLFLFFIPLVPLPAQNSPGTCPEELFRDAGEIYFTFTVGTPQETRSLTRIISIDHVQGNQVFAYANLKEFMKFLELGYPYTVLPHPGSLLSESELRPSGIREGPMTIWNYYPYYFEYLDFMYGFETAYPDICKVVFIGNSVLGRELLAVKISDNVSDSEGEPEVLYTSSMHGDELTGYVMMLHLIDHLLLNYGNDQRITDMVDNTEIFINPLANPDGTFYGGNYNISQAKRYNAHWIDLNRNYPDPEDGPHPDGNAWQDETVAFMAFADSNHFVMGANFHGGAEVFNYPWDTWAKLAADDDWWQYVGHEYADTVQEYGPPGYFTNIHPSGIINGYQWYTISGGRQDYMNYWHSDREVTLEISINKLPPASQLLNFWEYNYRSLLNYIEQANFGVQGIVTDSVTGEPLLAGVFIPGHDIDHSNVSSKLPSGFYSRLLHEGSYDMQFTAFGYFPKIIQGVEVTTRTTTHLDVELVPLNVGHADQVYTRAMMAYPNPSDGRIELLLPETGLSEALVECFDMTGRNRCSRSLTISPGMTSVELDLAYLSPGLYLLRLTSGPSGYTDRIIIR